jgi:glycosyltransferase involved in cell wall biosynthesis
MTDSPFFSIVIPTYNRANLIVKTLDSVFGQTYGSYEVIVVDNCSSDATVEVLRPLAEAGKIRFIRHDKNYERAVSRNTGMQAARGNYLTFLDSDDLMYPQNLSEAWVFATQHPELDVFQNRYELIDQQGTTLYRYPFPSLHNPIRAIAEGNFISCIGIFISRKVYTEFRFDSTELLQGIEDWDLWLRILARYRMGRIDNINSGIVHHAGRSITQYALDSYLEKSAYVRRKIENDIALRSTYAPYLNAFEASCYLLAASMANEAGLFRASGDYLKAAIRINWTVLFSLRYLQILRKSVFKIKSKITNE